MLLPFYHEASELLLIRQDPHKSDCLSVGPLSCFPQTPLAQMKWGSPRLLLCAYCPTVPISEVDLCWAPPQGPLSSTEVDILAEVSQTGIKSTRQ